MYAILKLTYFQAVDSLNGNEVKGCKLYVARAQKKNERQAELREKYEKLKMERLNRYQQGTVNILANTVNMLVYVPFNLLIV